MVIIVAFQNFSSTSIFDECDKHCVNDSKYGLVYFTVQEGENFHGQYSTYGIVETFIKNLHLEEEYIPFSGEFCCNDVIGDFCVDKDIKIKINIKGSSESEKEFFEKLFIASFLPKKA